MVLQLWALHVCISQQVRLSGQSEEPMFGHDPKHETFVTVLVLGIGMELELELGNCGWQEPHCGQTWRPHSLFLISQSRKHYSEENMRNWWATCCNLGQGARARLTLGSTNNLRKSSQTGKRGEPGGCCEPKLLTNTPCTAQLSSGLCCRCLPVSWGLTVCIVQSLPTYLLQTCRGPVQPYFPIWESQSKEILRYSLPLPILVLLFSPYLFPALKTKEGNQHHLFDSCLFMCLRTRHLA